jgi:23S rRNA (cytidine2498-2'-O)-methyltransferase
VTDFLYATCLVGAEKLLKAEMARRYPDLRPAFMRPGFVTFKSERGPLQVSGTFVQSAGRSLGKDEPATRAKLPKPPFGLAVYGPGVEPQELDPLRETLTAELGATPLPELGPKAQVVDVVVLPEQHFFGVHDYDPQDLLHPGVYRPELPPEAPSRAWLKLEEALRLSGAPVKAGQRALELGSAPGGAAWALLSRGLSVTGVDPAQMDERVARHPKYRHLSRSIALLEPRELPAADWILSDMNVAPEQTLQHVLRLLETLRPQGVFLTLKLKDERAARMLSADANDLSARGFEVVGTRQLPSHRQEVLLYGLTAAAAAASGLHR